MTDAPLIRPVTPADRPGWEALYAAYAGFYAVPQTPEMRDRVWSWIGGGMGALVAEDVASGALLGFVHYRSFLRPLAGSTGGYIDDLYVTPEARGAHLGETLIEAVAAIGRAEGWSILRWITAPTNARARALYDRVAAAQPWVTYDRAL